MLAEYTDLEEKKQHFKEYWKICSPDEFWEMCRTSESFEKKNSQKYLFRGINSAQFKLYSSAQRLWSERDLSHIGLTYEQYVNNLIGLFNKRGSVLNQYFNRMGIICNDWLILSFLQHYGAGTPLLDFTKHFKTALFFALDNLVFSGKGGPSDYISVYYYKTVDVANGMSSSIFKLAKDKASTIPEWDKLGQLWKDLSYMNVMRENETILVPAYANKSTILNKRKKLVSIYTVANLNSTAQDGEFVCNRDSALPLEDIWNKDDTKYLSCIDIHKGLYDYILYEYLKVDSIESARKTYYPNEQELAKKIQISALSSL